MALVELGQATGVKQPPSFILYGNSIYYRLYLNNETWIDASQKAAAIGGQLIRVEYQEEQVFINKNLGIYFNEIMTGASDPLVNGNYINPDGSKITYSNFLPGYPNPWGRDQPTAYALIITREYFNPWENWFTGGWYSDETTIKRNTSLVDTVNNRIATGVYAEIPLALSVYRSGQVKEAAGTFTTSISLSAGNSSSGNLANGATVYWKVTGITSDDLDSGALTGSGVISNGKLDVQHSLKRDSDTGESFNFSVFSDSAYTLQIGTASSAAVQEGASSNPGPTIRGNSLYQVVSGPTWTAAEENSTTLGGHLFTVNGESENSWLGTEFSKATYEYPEDDAPWAPNEYSINHYWGGGQLINGTWQWVSGEAFSANLSSLYLNNYRSDPQSNKLMGIFNNPNHWSNIYLDDSRDTYPTNPGSPIKGIAEIPLTLSITRSSSFKEGSDAVTSSINLSAGTSASGNLANGQTIYWKVTGITSDDLTSGSHSGSGLISNGKLDITHALKVDSDQGESFSLSVFSDSSYTQQIGSTSTASIEEALLPSSVTVNGNNNGIANAGTINNNGTINTGTINTNSGNTTNNTTNTTVNNTNITYNYYTNTTNNANSNNTTNNVNSNNTLNTWNIFRVDATVKVAEIVNQWFGTSAPTSKQTQDVTDTKLLDINASTWSDKIQINRVAKATNNGDILEALMPDIGGDPRVGSVLNGGAGKDVISGRAGWDVLDGGDDNDLIHGGNGRDIITGGAGRDELHGDFGWNTYKSEKDGVSDLVAIKSDQYLVNWIYGKAGNNADGSKCDIIEGLDTVDKIKIIGVDTRDITFAANVTAKGLTGIGIYGKGALEALYTGGDLTINQITQMTSGDASAAAMANQVNSYGTW